MKLWKVFLSILILLSSCGTYAWDGQIWVDEGVPREYHDVLKWACDKWNTATKKKICTFKGYTKGNVLSYMKMHEGYFNGDSSKLAKAFWGETGQVCQIQLVSEHFGLCSAGKKCYSYPKDVYKNIILHELGHCWVHAYHSTDRRDVMWPYASFVTEPSERDIKKVLEHAIENELKPGGANGE